MNLGSQLSFLLSSVDRKSRSWQSRILVFGSILLAAVLLVWILRDFNWLEFFSILQRMDYRPIPLLCLLSAINYFLRSIRWGVLFPKDDAVSLREIFWANMVGYLGNIIFPARSGEIVRAVYLSRRSELGTVSVLAAGFAERILDAAALIALGSISLTALRVDNVELQSALGNMAWLGVIGAVALLSIFTFGRPILQYIARKDFAPRGIKEKFVDWADQLTKGLQPVFHIRNLLAFGLLTLSIWSLDAGITIYLAATLNVPLSFPQAVVLLAGLGLSSAIPSSPGYIGVYQFVAVVILGAFGIAKESTLSFLIVAQILNIALVATLGGYGIWRFSRQR